MEKKITSMGWWGFVKSLLKYAGYILILVESVQYFVRRVEEKDGITTETPKIDTNA